MSLKRDNWTNEEIVDILKGCMLCDNEHNQKFVDDYNEGIQHALEYFSYHFAIDPADFGAMSYDPKTKMIYHTGEILPS
jgi:hypothetical protein